MAGTMFRLGVTACQVGTNAPWMALSPRRVCLLHTQVGADLARERQGLLGVLMPQFLPGTPRLRGQAAQQVLHLAQLARGQCFARGGVR